MINRSALVVGHEPAFVGWLKGTGLTEDAICKRNEVAEKRSISFLHAFTPRSWTRS